MRGFEEAIKDMSASEILLALDWIRGADGSKKKNLQRNIQIFLSARAGKSFVEISKSHKLSPEQVRCICSWVAFRVAANKRARDQNRRLIWCLSVRAINILNYNGICTDEDVHEAYRRHGPAGFLRMTNFGRTSLKELEEVFGYAPSFKKKAKKTKQKRISREHYERCLGVVTRYRRQERMDKSRKLLT